MTRHFCILLGLIFATSACGEADEPTLIENEKVETAEERVDPVLTVFTPERGVFSNSTAVVVGGTVQQMSAPISSVKVNGSQVQLRAGGDFQHELVLQPGPNIIDVRAEAEDNGRAVDAMTVFGGRIWPEGARIEDAMQIHLGRSFFDDNDPDLDDVATVVELLISDEQFLQAFIAEPFAIGDDEIQVTRIEIGGGEVDIEPEENCVNIVATITDASLEAQTEGIASILGETVYIDADAATVRTLVCGASDSAIELEVVDAEVSFDNLRLATNEYPDIKEDLPTTHDTLQRLLEGAIGRWIGGSLGGLLTGFINDFAVDYTFGTAPPITFSFEVTGLDAQQNGLAVNLSGSISAPLGLPEMPESAGSLRTDDAALPGGFSDAPIALAVADDTLNQLLFTFYWSNAAASAELPPEATAELPEVFQPLNELNVGLDLPATIVPATQQDDFPYDIAVGGITLDILAGQDRRIGAGLHFQAGVNLLVEEGGLLTAKIDDRAQKINVKANITQVPESVDRGDLAALFRFMLPPILGQVEVAGGIPLPDIDLASFSANAAAFEGRTLRFVPSQTGKQGDGGGYFVIEGTFEETSGAPEPNP